MTYSFKAKFLQNSQRPVDIFSDFNFELLYQHNHDFFSYFVERRLHKPVYFQIHCKSEDNRVRNPLVLHQTC